MSVATTFSLGDISTDRIKRIVVTRRGKKTPTVMDDIQSVAMFQHTHAAAEVKWNKEGRYWTSTVGTDAYVSFTAKLKD